MQSRNVQRLEYIHLELLVPWDNHHHAWIKTSGAGHVQVSRMGRHQSATAYKPSIGWHSRPPVLRQQIKQVVRVANMPTREIRLFHLPILLRGVHKFDPFGDTIYSTPLGRSNTSMLSGAHKRYTRALNESVANASPAPTVTAVAPAKRQRRAASRGPRPTNRTTVSQAALTDWSPSRTLLQPGDSWPHADSNATTTSNEKGRPV